MSQLMTLHFFKTVNKAAREKGKMATLVAASTSHFLIAAIKCSCFSSNEIRLFCFLPFSVIHVSVDIKS